MVVLFEGIFLLSCKDFIRRLLWQFHKLKGEIFDSKQFNKDNERKFMTL